MSMDLYRKINLNFFGKPEDEDWQEIEDWTTPVEITIGTKKGVSEKKGKRKRNKWGTNLRNTP